MKTVHDLILHVFWRNYLVANPNTIFRPFFFNNVFYGTISMAMRIIYNKLYSLSHSPIYIPIWLSFIPYLFVYSERTLHLCEIFSYILTLYIVDSEATVYNA